MGVETAAILGASALASGAGLYGQAKAEKGANKRSKQLQQQAYGMMQTDPGQAEQALLGLLPYIQSGNQSFNAGQDALSQMLRSDPSTQRSYVDDVLQGIATQDDPFAPGGAYSALDAVNQRANQTQVAGLRGGAGSVGQRYGSNFANAEGRMRADMAERDAAGRAGLAQAFTGQRLNAAGIAAQRQAQQQGHRLAAAQSSGQLGMGQIGAMLQALQGAGGMEAGRNQYNASLFGAAAGVPFAPSSVGQGIGEAGTGLAALYYLLQGGGGGRPRLPTGTVGTTTPGMMWG